MKFVRIVRLEMAKSTRKQENKEEEILEEIAKDIFSKLGLDVVIEVSKDEENDCLNLNIDPGDAAGLLIGNRGRNLLSLQTLISIIFQKRFGKWMRIVLDIAKWREKEKLRLEDLARQVAEKVRISGQPQPLYNLSPAQRRTIHLYLSKEKDIKTESVGEGEGRYLVVSLK